ncbi:hypothetical protein ACRALDRAFT_1082791 [Sodiomyces alcalophilus JCM 7366]|uniref:uncharacterized protein n=1 Tax=Sodiomyces alcalophilus JCM 7366 TaxID=591952 RepID=UPI0039B5E6B5
MAATEFNYHGYRMGPQIRVRNLEAANVVPQSTPAPLVARERECDADNANLCEKPVQSMTLPIVLGVVIPLVAAIGVLIFLHRRNVRKQRREEAADPNRDLDFGLDGEVVEHTRGGGKRQSLREKMMRSDGKHRAQISMDMNLSSPYLLPPGLQGSRESLHSLSRTLHTNEDPYRPVQYYGSEVGSIRSIHHDKESGAGSSVYTGSTERQSSLTGRTLPPRQASLPQPPPPTADPFATPTSTVPPHSLSPTSPTRQPLSHGIVPEIGTVPYPNDQSDDWTNNTTRILDVPEVTEPLPVATSTPRNGTQGASSPPPAGTATLNDRQAEPIGALSLPEIGVGFDFTMPDGPSHSDATSPRVQSNQQESGSFSPLPTIIPEEASPYVVDHGQQEHQEDDYEERGRSTQRRSMDGDYRKSQALGVPQQDMKRLSVGLRPLPPDEITESEDPEERANRIRSFYKEYFDDSKPTEPLPPPPHQQQQQHSGVSYYEDYDAKYLGGDNNAFYDPDSNAFVMPYAEPVTRRAMTPPPAASRLRGPPPPRAMHGSMGGMSMPGGRRPPPPRAGTSMSNRWGPPSRPGSSLSSSYGQPRPGSSVSNRFQRPAKPKGPPPAALTTLPTPAKLADDSLALLGSIDFAPPESYEDRQRGRSQSPLGERRPYAPKKPVASPLVSSFDEMPAVPSPHLLRKSGTFTALDFAPPRRFANDDGMSDAGSIRSNRSGLSAANAYAIRSGVGRVSRLPEDTVFTQAKMDATLKPSWNMRD